MFPYLRAAALIVIVAAAVTLAFFLYPGGVTTSTVLELGNPLLTMFFLNLDRIVLVAAVASVGLQAFSMTDLALAYSAVPMIDGEGMRSIIAGRRPGLIRMAGGAVRAEQAQVDLRIRVAGLALLGGTFEDRPCIPL